MPREAPLLEVEALGADDGEPYAVAGAALTVGRGTIATVETPA